MSWAALGRRLRLHHPSSDPSSFLSCSLPFPSSTWYLYTLLEQISNISVGELVLSSITVPVDWILCLWQAGLEWDPWLAEASFAYMLRPRWSRKSMLRSGLFVWINTHCWFYMRCFLGCHLGAVFFLLKRGVESLYKELRLNIKRALGRVGKVLYKHQPIVKRARTRGLWVVVSMQDWSEYIIQPYITYEANAVYRLKTCGRVTTIQKQSRVDGGNFLYYKSFCKASAQ